MSPQKPSVAVEEARVAMKAACPGATHASVDAGCGRESRARGKEDMARDLCAAHLADAVSFTQAALAEPLIAAGEAGSRASASSRSGARRTSS